MKSDSLMEQVTGILVRREIPFEFHEGGQEIGVRASRGPVFLRPRESDGALLLQIQTDVAVGIDLTPEVAGGIYVWLNQRNAEEPLVRYVLHEVASAGGGVRGAWVAAEWELEAGRLESESLMLSLKVVARAAGSGARQLTELFGGQTPAQVREECDALNRGELDDGLDFDDFH